LTRESYEALQEELKRSIREERPKVIQAIARPAHGDLSENAEYDAAKHNQASRRPDPGAAGQACPGVRGRSVQPEAGQSCFGATVTIYDTASEEETTFKIVGEDEADIKHGKISYTSPVGKALIGHNWMIR